MEKEKAVDRVKKLLALSNSPNSNEADTALRMANKLIAEFALKREEYTATLISEAFVYHTVKRVALPWQRQLFYSITKLTGCTSYSHGRSIVAYGELETIEIAQAIFKSLYHQIENQVKYIKTTDLYTCLPTRGERKSFIARYKNGLVFGVQKKINEILVENSKSQGALVPYRKRVEESLASEIKLISKRNNYPISSAGVADGQALSVHTEIK